MASSSNATSSRSSSGKSKGKMRKDKSSKDGSTKDKKTKKKESKKKESKKKESKKKERLRNSTSASSDRKKKPNSDNSATAKGASKSPSKKSKKSTKGSKDSIKSSSSKVPPKSKHHHTKPKRHSIKERVAAAAANTAASKKKHAVPRSMSNANNNFTRSMANNSSSSRGGGRNSGAFSRGNNIRNDFPRSTYGSITSSNSNRAAKNKKGRSKKNIVQYRMSLSECNDDVYFNRVDVPWYSLDCWNAEEEDSLCDEKERGRDATNNDAAGPSENGRVDDGSRPAPTLAMPPETILRQIDVEIQSFGKYVKLTPSEKDARLAFLDHVTNLAVEQFSHPSYGNNGSNGGYTGGRAGGNGESFFLGAASTGGGNTATPSSLEEFQEEEIHVAPFGSFATQEVCTFASDVDMCLWGVVKGGGAKTTSTFTRQSLEDGDAAFVAVREDGCSDSDDEDVSEAVELNTTSRLDGGKTGCPLLTESSLLRTMDAIQYAQPDSATAEANAGTRNADKKDSLFFIDRTGELKEDGAKGGDDVEVIDLSQNDEETSENKEATTKAPSHDQPQQLEKGDGEKTTAENIKGGNNDEEPRMAGDFEFAIDSQGVEELGGDVEDFTKSSPSNDNANEPVTQASKGTNRQVMMQLQAAKTELECATEAVAGESKMEGLKNDNNSTKAKEEENAPSALGKSAQDAIDVDDDSDGDVHDEVIVVDSDDDDSADKMSSYHNRQNASKRKATNTGDNEVDALDTMDRVNALSEIIQIDDYDDDDDDDASSSSCPSSSSDDGVEEAEVEAEDDYLINSRSSDEEDDDDDNIKLPPLKLSSKSNKNEVLELSLTSSNNNPSSEQFSNAPKQQQQKQQPPKKAVVGPTGRTRTRVISALQSLTRQLRRSAFTHTIECRTRARVPIVNCNTRTGFEGDIAVGGHNGVDTSAYAMDQVKRFVSFAPIVLILKVLMAQNDFDKPFTGGLGSYKLYVLVAYHIESHLANGGIDRPSEVLISLLFRYGCVGARHDKATTDLEQLRNGEVSSDGGTCELTPVFRLGDCVSMFRECHRRLFDRILMEGNISMGSDTSISYLSSIIDCYRLKEARETSDRRSKLCDSICHPHPIPRDHPGKVLPGRKIGKVFSKNTSDSNGAQGRGGELKRGPRGGILPKKRPDMEAKNSLRGNRDADAIQRGMKNRKNNKKQKRDAPGRSFASRHSF